MQKFVTTYFTTLLFLISFAQSTTYRLSGKVVSINSGKGIPYAVVMTSHTKGFQSDSLGNFTVYNLTPGQHTLTFSASGYITKKDTLMTMPNHDVTDFIFAISTDCSSSSHFSEAKAINDIKRRRPRLLLIGSIAPIYYPSQKIFEKKYNISYYDFGCTPDLQECILSYNKTVFAYLDKKYGEKWRKEVRQDVIGLNDK